MRKLLTALSILTAVALAPLAAQAQYASCPLSQEVPTQVTAARTVGPNDVCRFFYVTTNNTTIALPAANTLPVGFHIWIKSVAGVTTTVSQTTGQLDGSSTSPLSISGGSGVGLYTDGTNFWSTGAGVSH